MSMNNRTWKEKNRRNRFRLSVFEITTSRLDVRSLAERCRLFFEDAKLHLPLTGELVLRKSASGIIACTSRHKAARISNFIMLISPRWSPSPISSFLFLSSICAPVLSPGGLTKKVCSVTHSNLRVGEAWTAYKVWAEWSGSPRALSTINPPRDRKSIHAELI